MDIFLTSSIGGNREIRGIKTPCAFDNSNHFVDLLKASCGLSPRVMAVSSTADGYEINDMYKNIYLGAFKASGFNIQKLVYVDNRNKEQLDFLSDFDLIILCGGHVPTQNAWFHEIDLKGRLASWDGTVVGISAGSMNSADIVYAQPEMEGEASDPNFIRYMPGLGLTDINILPHFIQVRRLRIDGFRVEKDLTIEDSYQRPILALNDGSFLHIHTPKIKTAHEDSFGFTYLYGTGWLFHKGKKTRLCFKGLRRRIY